jgi:hypothetical protein
MLEKTGVRFLRIANKIEPMANGLVGNFQSLFQKRNLNFLVELNYYLTMLITIVCIRW